MNPTVDVGAASTAGGRDPSDSPVTPTELDCNAARRLREREERFRALLEYSYDLTVVLDAEARCIYLSPAVTRRFGYAPEDMLGRSIFDLVHPDDRAALADSFRTRSATPGAGELEEYRFRQKDGAWRTLEIVGTNLFDHPAVAGLVVNARDVTERRKAEEVLRASEERFRSLLNLLPVGVLVSDAEGRVVDCNPSALRIGGVERLEGWSLTDLHRFEAHSAATGEPVAPRDRALARVLRGEEALEPDEIEIVGTDGARRSVLAHGVPLRGEEGAGAGSMVTLIDVTELRGVEAERERLEAQLRQSQKMEAVGRLAGGIAHDFNNVLTSIRGYADFLFQDLPEGDRLRADVQEIRDAADRATGLVRQLLAFSRKQVLQSRPLDLEECVTGMEGMLRRLIGEDVALVRRSAPDLGLVRADPGQIQQVLLNLVVNARDALPTGGTITIETRNVLLDAEQARAKPGLAPGAYVGLTVEDSGHGIEPEVLPHIFEPFFTTKGPGRGTGLGLATVYGIVTQSGGQVEVSSAVGHGTSFVLYFPHAGARTAETAAGTPRPARVGGEETILLVEDEAAVRAFGRRALERHGYAVLEAAGGEQALELLRARAGEIRLVVTDVVMPEMSGRELAERIAERWPAIQVLYTSGYTEDEVLRRGVLELGDRYLPKPFSPDAIAGKVREILDAPPA